MLYKILFYWIQEIFTNLSYLESFREESRLSSFQENLIETK